MIIIIITNNDENINKLIESYDFNDIYNMWIIYEIKFDFIHILLEIYESHRFRRIWIIIWIAEFGSFV